MCGSSNEMKLPHKTQSAKPIILIQFYLFIYFFFAAAFVLFLIAVVVLRWGNLVSRPYSHDAIANTFDIELDHSPIQ